MVSNVSHDIVIGNQSGAAVQNKPSMLLLIVRLRKLGRRWSTLGLVMVTLLVLLLLGGGKPGNLKCSTAIAGRLAAIAQPGWTSSGAYGALLSLRCGYSL
jgi:hypothetical protein